MKNFSFKIAFNDTYKFLINNIVLFSKTSFIIILLYSLIEYKINSYLSNIGSITDNGYNLLVIIFGVILQLVLLTMFVVVWGGYYLKKIPTIKIIDVLNWHEIKTKYIIASLKLVGVIILLSILSSFTVALVSTLNVNVISYLVIILTVFVQLIILTRIMFIFPDVIDGFSGKISDAINITKDNSIKLLFSYIGVIFPLLIIISLFIVTIDYNSYGYFETLIITIFIFISHAITTVYYINVYKQLTK